MAKLSLLHRQLTKLPANAGRKFARACVDSPSEADVFEVKARDGDIVVAYVCQVYLKCASVEVTKYCLQTDGFSDNVFPSEMITICSLIARNGGSEEEQVQMMADRMVDYARQCMKSKTRVSPFERRFHLAPSSFRLLFIMFCALYLGEASREGMYFRGGVSIPLISTICRYLNMFSAFSESRRVRLWRLSVRCQRYSWFSRSVTVIVAMIRETS